MVALVDRCHACGTLRDGQEVKFCAKCGAELPVAPAPEPVPAGGIAWNYRIPVINNRYVWVRWCWAAFATGMGFGIVLGTLIVVMFGGSDQYGGAVAFAVRIYLALGLIPAAVVIVCGLLAALVVSNDVSTRFELSPRGVVAQMSRQDSAGIQDAAWFLTRNARNASQAVQIASLLLPSGGNTQWKDVRRAEFDEVRRVITLRRRWHSPFRIYLPEQRFAEVAAYVREHLPSPALKAS